MTALGAAGCHIVLFTTGRGTPLGGVIPTMKIATNTPLAEKKKHWIDFDAGPIATGAVSVADLRAPFIEIGARGGERPADPKRGQRHRRDRHLQDRRYAVSSR